VQVGIVPGEHIVGSVLTGQLQVRVRHRGVRDVWDPTEVAGLAHSSMHVARKCGNEAAITDAVVGDPDMNAMLIRTR